jgi:hypothetical protein
VDTPGTTEMVRVASRLRMWSTSVASGEKVRADGLVAAFGRSGQFVF